MKGVLIFPFVFLLVLFCSSFVFSYGKQEGETEQYISSEFQEERQRMVEDQIESRGVKDPLVLEAMKTIPRHLFVTKDQQKRAYNDYPLPIGYGQTISQPYIVAYMTELLRLSGGEKILEIGTGSGYQAAVLAYISDKVYTIEIIEELGTRTSRLIEKLGYSDRIHITIGDGYYGWEEHAPYDGIIVTAAAGHVPPPLIEQLKPGGRIVIPVGGPYQVQTLVIVSKDDKGNVSTRNLLPVRFVPMTGRAQSIK